MELKEKMELLIRQQKESGLNKKAFCRQQEINYYRFDYWYRKSNKREAVKKEAGFVKIDTARDRIPKTNPALEIVYPNGVKISTATGELELVAKLIRLY